MKNALKQSETEAPRSGNLAVVSTLTPAMGLLCLEPVEEYPKGKVITCYGGYGSIRYIPGFMPKDLRTAAMDEDYCNEVIIGNFLPNCIQEIDLDEYPPGTMKLVVMDAEIIEAPELEEAREQGCKVIKHWSSYGVQPKAKKQKEIAPGTLYIFPFAEPEVKPINQIA